MKSLIAKTITSIEAGEKVVLCTILASSGSSPRGAGARMAVFEDNTTLGTVGGGPVELQAAQDAQKVLRGELPHIRAFCLQPEQVASIGMICGGEVTVYYQLLSEADLPTLREFAKALDTDANSWLYLKISDGAVEDFKIVDSETASEAPELFKTRSVLLQEEAVYYTEPIVRAGSVYIFGGGHVGQALVPVLANVGFRVVVYDNREFLANQKNFPQAERVIFGDYRQIETKVTLTENDYAVIMTPGHQADYEILEQVLRHRVRYVGCIGSRKKIEKTQEKLRAAGISEEAIRSVHSPIGLPILAETPAEIAISIAAEMIQCRAETK